MNYTKSIRVTADVHETLQLMATEEKRDICVVTDRVIELGLEQDVPKSTDKQESGTAKAGEPQTG